jgi:hypothetical protein
LTAAAGTPEPQKQMGKDKKPTNEILSQIMDEEQRKKYDYF